MQGSHNKKSRQFRQGADRVQGDGGFLDSHERGALPAVSRICKGEQPEGARATAILHLDDGRSVACAAKALQAGENAVRAWRQAFRKRDMESIGMAGCSKREGLLSGAREERLRAMFAERPPRDAVEVRARIVEEFGADCSRRGAPASP